MQSLGYIIITKGWWILPLSIAVGDATLFLFCVFCFTYSFRSSSSSESLSSSLLLTNDGISFLGNVLTFLFLSLLGLSSLPLSSLLSSPPLTDPHLLIHLYNLNERTLLLKSFSPHHLQSTCPLGTTVVSDAHTALGPTPVVYQSSSSPVNMSPGNNSG